MLFNPLKSCSCASVQIVFVKNSRDITASTLLAKCQKSNVVNCSLCPHAISFACGGGAIFLGFGLCRAGASRQGVSLQQHKLARS